MDTDGQRYYKMTRIYLTALGLWPYNVSIYKRIYRTIILFIFISSVFTQFATLHATNDFDQMLYNLTYAVPSLIYTLKFTVYIICADDVVKLLESMWNDWKAVKNEKELEIIRYSTVIGKRYALLVLAGLIPLLFIYALAILFFNILDVVYPLEEPRVKLPIIAEYFFIDVEKYHFPVLIYQLLVIVYGISTVFSTETLNLLYAHHACGLFAIASYRLKHAFDDASSLPDNNKSIILRARIVDVIKIHDRCIQFMDYVRLVFNPSYSILLMLGVVTITINAFRLLQALATMDDFEELVISVIFVWGQYTYLFFTNFFGQKVTNYSNRVYNTACETLWYTAPKEIQKMMILILQRTTKGYLVSISGLIVASLETFASLTSMTLSYLTVIYSVR